MSLTSEFERRYKGELAHRGKTGCYSHHRLRKYGLTVADYNKLFEAQNGLCAVCHRPETLMRPKGGFRALAVDHDHKTEAVRGLLCGRCNSALGLLDENIDRILSLAEYVRSFVGR